MGLTCSPTLPEPEEPPLRYLDTDSATTSFPADSEPSAQDPWQGGQNPRSASSTSSTGSGSAVVPTEPKTQCIDDVREQTEQTAQVPVPDPPAVMVPVMQLSAEANAIVAAIDGALGSKTRWDTSSDGFA